MLIIPQVTQQDQLHGSDLFSRLLQDRIVLLGGKIDDDAAQLITAQLLYLEAQDPTADVSLYINSPGGSVTAGLAIVDTMEHISCPVSTIVMGQAASMAAIILAAGTKGKRKALPHAEVMIHQPMGGSVGQTTDVLIHASRLERCREVSIALLSHYTGTSSDTLRRDMERDHFLTAEEARTYGIVDQVL